MDSGNEQYTKESLAAPGSSNALANFVPGERENLIHTYEKVRGEVEPSKTRSFRVGTFNIRYSDTEPGKANHAIFKSGVDLLGVQEVRNILKIDFLRDYTNKHSMQHKLKNGFFFKNLRIPDGTDYGNGLLSRFDLLSTSGKHYEYREGEQRSYIQAEVLIHGRVVSFYTTHFDVEHSQRVKEIAELFKAVEADEHAYKIICGDVNTEDYQGELGAFLEAGYLSVQGNKGQFYTSYEPGPGEDEVAAAIDNIFLTPNFDIVNINMVNHEGASDHHLLYADIQFKTNS